MHAYYIDSGIYAGKGKAAAHAPAPMNLIQSSSPPTSSSASDNEDDTYFSDVSSSTSSTLSTSPVERSSPKLGDFIFDSDEEYADYFAVVNGTPERRSISARSEKLPKKKSKKSSYRKGSSAFFLSGSSFPSLPVLSSSFTAQNPGIKSAAQTLQQRVQRLNSLSNSAPESESSEDVDRSFERALQFASWTKTSTGQWEAPANANAGLRKLVETSS